MTIYTKSSWDDEVEVNVEAYAEECKKALDKAVDKYSVQEDKDEMLETGLELLTFAPTNEIDIMIDFLTAIYDARLTTSRKKTDE